MTFLHLGLAAAAAACVAIPIAIHLLMRRRRKPVMWGAMRFLVEAYRRQRKRLMLEQWLLLASRCLLVLLLGLAIARPLMGGLGPAPGGRTVYLLIDNGLASTATAAGPSAGESALSRHKALAERVLSQLAASEGAEVGDRVALITMGGPAEGMVVPPSGDLDAVRRLIAGIGGTDSRTDIHGALSLAASAIQGQNEREGDAGARTRRTYVVVLSDFLEGSAGVDTPLPTLPEGTTLLASSPARAGADNVSIAAVEPLRSLVVSGGGAGSEGMASAEQVRITLRRSGPGVAQPGVAGVRVRVGGAEGGAGVGVEGSGRGVVRFDAGQEEATGVAPVNISFAPGVGADARPALAMLTAELDADAIAGDNTWRRPIEVRQTLRVGVVGLRRFGEVGRVDQLSPTEWLRLALRPWGGEGGMGDVGPIEVTEIEPGGLDVGRLARLDTLVLPRPDLLNEEMWRRVRGFADAGGLVFVMPPAGATVHVWADVMARELGLNWTLPREARTLGTPNDGGAGGVRLTAPAGSAGVGGEDLLALLRPELEELTRPVSFFRALPVQFGDRGTDPDAQRLLALSDGSVVLWAGPPGQAAAGAEGTTEASAPQGEGRGLIVYLGTALDLSWSDLPARPAMVPLMQEIVRQGIGRARGSWWGLAGRNVPTPPRTVELVRVEERGASGRGAREGEGRDGAAAGIVRVGAAGATMDAIRSAGLWRAVDDRGGARGVVAINADPRGGLGGAQAAPDVERWLRASGGEGTAWLSDAETGGGEAALASALAGDDRGPPISLPLLIAAACLALAEMGLARWASHAETGA